jgi:hypothetical protein
MEYLLHIYFILFYRCLCRNKQQNRQQGRVQVAAYLVAYTTDDNDKLSRLHPAIHVTLSRDDVEYES